MELEALLGTAIQANQGYAQQFGVSLALARQLEPARALRSGLERGGPPADHRRHLPAGPPPLHPRPRRGARRGLVRPARLLVQRGHVVRVLADPTIEPEARATGCDFTPWTTAPHRTSRDRSADIVSNAFARAA